MKNLSPEDMSILVKAERILRNTGIMEIQLFVPLDEYAPNPSVVRTVTAEGPEWGSSLASIVRDYVAYKATKE